MAIDENGVDIGRTWGDLTSEVSRAIITLGTVPEVTKLNGLDWNAHRMGRVIIAVVMVPDDEG